MAVQALSSTYRFHPSDNQNYLQFWERGEPVIFAIWHGCLLPLAYLHKNQDLVVMISRSRDGERVAQLVKSWGYSVVRASSSRAGGAGLRSMMRHARAGRSLVFTADGPRGPRHRLKAGVLLGAQLTGLPIIPSVAGTSRAWRLNSWDRFMVPKPFADVRVGYGEPRWVPRRLNKREMLRLQPLVESDLNSLLRRMDQHDTG